MDVVYLDNNALGRGIGSKLYSHLLDKLKARSVHAVIAGIAVPNEPSIHLHKKMGFQKVARFKEVGFKMEKWIDVEYWELLFDPL